MEPELALTEALDQGSAPSSPADVDDETHRPAKRRKEAHQRSRVSRACDRCKL